MNLFERRRIAQATVNLHVGKLPLSGERVPHVNLPKVKVRVLRSAFFFADSIPEAGQVLRMDVDDARGLEARGLVQLL